MENNEYDYHCINYITVAVLKDKHITLFFLLSLLPNDRATQIEPRKKYRISQVLKKMTEHENSPDHQRAFKEWQMLEMILH